MNPPFPLLNSCVLLLLQESYDPNGKHMEYRDSKGAIFARMAKVSKKGAFLQLFDVFQPAKEVYAELRDTNNNLLLTTMSHYGSTKRECRVDINLPDGTLFGRLYDASYGVDFTLPDDTLLGTARRPNDFPTEPQEVVYTFSNAAGQVVGTCERTFPHRNDSLWDYLESGGVTLSGLPLQSVKLEPGIEPTLQTLLLLFPALQHLRYARSG